MKKKIIFFATAFFILGLNPVFGENFNYNPYSERIKNFNAAITVNENGFFSVRENIVYDFGSEIKHGIYRDIPLKNLSIEVSQVTDKFGAAYPYKISRGNENLRIKIGDPEKVITGRHAYNISYRVWNGIGYFQNHDEIFWNVTGNNWEVPIEKSSVIIRLPRPISKNDLKMDCFTGFLGAKEKDCVFEFNYAGNISFESNKVLSSKEGFTVVLGWPKGIVRAPNFFQKILWNFKKDYWPVIIPITVFIFLFIKWWRSGRDTRFKKTVVVQYDPPDNLRPIEVKLIMNEKITKVDISTIIIDLAVRGYIKIKEIKKTSFFGKDDYELVKIREVGDKNEFPTIKDLWVSKEEINKYEKDFLEDIFGTKERILSSDLKNSFFVKISELKDKVYSKMTHAGYFFSNPGEAIKKTRRIGSVLIILTGIFFL